MGEANFPVGILDQVWCLIVSIPDICHLSYFIQVLKTNQHQEQPMAGLSLTMSLPNPSQETLKGAKDGTKFVGKSVTLAYTEMLSRSR